MFHGVAKNRKKENKIDIFKDWILVLLISSIAFNFQFHWFYSIFFFLLLLPLGLNHSFLSLVSSGGSLDYWFKILFLFCCCWCLFAQSRWIFWGPMDCSLAVSSVHGISQTRILEWVAFPSPVSFLVCACNAINFSLSTAFATSHKVLQIVFSLLFGKDIFNFLLRLLWLICNLGVCGLIYKYLDIFLPYLCY